MTRPPQTPPKTPSASRITQRAAEGLAGGLERALDPFTNAVKRAVQTGADAVANLTHPSDAEAPKAAAPGKPGLAVSPLAVPLSEMPPVGGVQLSTAQSGFYKHDRKDTLLMKFAEGTTCAGVFTRHTIGSAPVDWCKKQLEANEGSDIRALICNAGCANAFTGKPGADAARRTASALSRRIDCRQRDIMLASTGVIGVVLDDSKIAAKLFDLDKDLRADAWADAAATIMTTDTFPKGASETAIIEGVTVRINGIAKGSGMIAPDMATMLAFIATDATLSPGVLQSLLALFTRTTFNSVTVDGDTSTNDTCLLFATGAAGAPKISRAGDKRLADFKAKLEKVMHSLATQLIRDGEGATKFVKVNVGTQDRQIDRRKPAGQDRAGR
jgi:glutamate N-acetyltransferase/amino-acid N-acetyltransferase